MDQSPLIYVLPAIYVLNIIFSFFVIFNNRRSATSTWAWLLVLFFLPIVGFILYIFLGRNLQKKNFTRWNAVHSEQVQSLFKDQCQQMESNQYNYPNAISKKHQQLIYMNIINNHALFAANNNVEIYSDGKRKFDAVIEDILQAKKHIHIQYYIFKMDEIGQSIYEALVKKAKEGVEVRVLFDDLGSRKLKKKHFKQLIENGGEVEAFFPSFFSLLNPRINFRNHRKLVIIDGIVGYIGGFNVGREYASLDEDFGYWHDMHLRIEGESLHSMQAHFLFDWQQARNEEQFDLTDDKFFPKMYIENVLPVQIVSSGPDTDFESIKDSYIRMILSAKKSVYIESPYFVPDEPFFNALSIAASSGVDVRVITPAKPDHMFIYGANSVYGGEILKSGGKMYRYEKGFLHAKMMIVDEEIVTIGTTNIDVRSFSLNFEINAIIFDDRFALKCLQIFKENIANSTEITKEIYANRPLYTKVREAISRLLSPIL